MRGGKGAEASKPWCRFRLDVREVFDASYNVDGGFLVHVDGRCCIYTRALLYIAI